ncbi:MAG: hypothetical protein HY607_08300 [Planctomycetes bacterium]|nr:hypothetical protein [Planctomycetota bacterium]
MDAIAVARILGVVGLCLDIVGAFLIFRYNHPIGLTRDAKGRVQAEIFPIPDQTPEGISDELAARLNDIWISLRRISRVFEYHERSRLGFFLLFIGFVCQGVSSVLQVWIAS